MSSEGSSDTGVRDWLNELREAFAHAAEEAGGVEERRIQVGGIPGRLRCAGTTQRALIGPFEHLERDGLGASDFDICLFDSASTGISPPGFPWPLPLAEAGIVPFVRVAAGDVCLVRDVVGGTTIAVDRAAAEVVFYAPDTAASGLLERAALLRDAVQMLLAPRRWLIHAAAVGSGEGGALVVGASGSGKSTLALACALSGMGIAGDDYVVLEPGSPPLAHAWNSTVKLTRAGVKLLSLDGERTDGWRFQETVEGPAKAVMGVEEVVPGSLRDAVPVTTLIAPRLSDRRAPRLTKVSAGTAMRALAPSTALQSRVVVEGLLEALGGLVRSVCAFELDLCRDVTANADAVARAVDSAA